ncbi:methyltransferase domain-containing protein [Nonomuraea angiospora]|uniref:methyltransferase domain-containing protein n=1 Tax=Nonomuraea angiospora TaxID=46172 RepID=UPI0037A188BA
MSSSQPLADPGSEPDTTSGGAVPPQPGAFDLVHARLVLVHVHVHVHVPDRARALATMVAALRPGGRLLVEDADTELQPLACLDEAGPAQQRANRLRRAVRELMTRRGADLRYGRTLPRALRAAGLVDVAAAGCFPVGGVACDRLETATVRMVRAELLAAGPADDAEIDAHLAAIDAGELDLTLAPLTAAWTPPGTACGVQAAVSHRPVNTAQAGVTMASACRA